MKTHAFALLLLLPSLALAQTDTSTNQPPVSPQGGGPGHWHHHGPINPDKILAHMTKKLDLSSSQQEEIKPMLVSEVNQMKALHENTSLTEEQKHEQFKSIHEATQKQIEQVLTPAQLTEFQKFHQGHKHHDFQPQGGSQTTPPTTT